MEKLIFVCVAALGLSGIATGLPVASVEHGIPEKGEEGVTVWRDGREALVRSRFSATDDLVVHVHRVANEDAYLVPRDMPITDYRKGVKLHEGFDDFSAINLGSFGNLSGNHGSYFGSLQTLPGHGFTDADKGSEVVHSSGVKYRLIAVPDKDHIIVHPDGAPGVSPGFVWHDKGSFRLGEREWTPEKVARVQVYPMNRFLRFEWKTADGRPVPEKVETRSRHIDLEMEHDVVDARAVMTYLKEHPGAGHAMPEFTEKWQPAFLDSPEAKAKLSDYAKLDALLNVRTVYRYEPECARLAMRTTKFVAPLASVKALDVIYCWPGRIGPWRDVEFYIPRMKKMTLSGRNGAPDVAVDFTAVEKMPSPPWNVASSASKADCIDPENMPDRFIRIAGDGVKRRIGVSLGYSLLQGMTALENRSAERPDLYLFWYTGKTYPYCFSLSNVPAGRTVVHHAYTQYFDPQAEPDATSFYYHRDGDSQVVYMDFHKTLVGKAVRLPTEFAGMKISVLQRSPSVTLHTADTVPPDGKIVLDVADGYGELVLRLHTQYQP